MKHSFLTVALAVTITGLLCSPSSNDLAFAAAPSDAPARLTAEPELEIATDTFAIIRWTIANPEGTDLHFGIVHYGTDPMHLNQIAKSPNRRNRSHPEMIFRVRIHGLNSHTTYYYRVESAGAAGASDEVSSAVSTFKTR